MAKTLSHSQAGQLGGLASARKATPEERQERARKGGQAVTEKYGRDHMKRLILRRWGYKVQLETEG